MTALIREYLRRAHNHELPREDPLSPREVEIVKLIAEGHSSKQIAEMLAISEKTVERHRANILEQLEMRDRVQLTRYAIRGTSSRQSNSDAPPVHELGDRACGRFEPDALAIWMWGQVHRGRRVSSVATAAVI